MLAPDLKRAAGRQKDSPGAERPSIGRTAQERRLTSHSHRGPVIWRGLCGSATYRYAIEHSSPRKEESKNATIHAQETEGRTEALATARAIRKVESEEASSAPADESSEMEQMLDETLREIAGGRLADTARSLSQMAGELLAARGWSATAAPPPLRPPTGRLTAPMTSQTCSAPCWPTSWRSRTSAPITRGTPMWATRSARAARGSAMRSRCGRPQTGRSAR